MEVRMIETSGGKVRGYEREGIREYLGIPYARPPVGELRLKRALPYTWEGVFDAAGYGPPSLWRKPGF